MELERLSMCYLWFFDQQQFVADAICAFLICQSKNEWQESIAPKLEPMWGTKKKIDPYIKKMDLQFWFLCCWISIYLTCGRDVKSGSSKNTVGFSETTHTSVLEPLGTNPAQSCVATNFLFGVSWCNQFFLFLFLGVNFLSPLEHHHPGNTALIIQQVAEIQTTSSWIDLIHKCRKDSSFLSFILSAFQENVG